MKAEWSICMNTTNAMEIIIVTGKSGTGKSVTVHTLEDMGYYCIDNLPLGLIPQTIEQTMLESSNIGRMAVVADCRSKSFGGSFIQMGNALKKQNIRFRLLFLDCAADKLLNRYKETRRRHPLQDEITGLAAAIALEESTLSEARSMADYYIDTTDLNRAALQGRITDMFLPQDTAKLMITCMSFGFKNGLPPEADFVLDVRCLPNPFYIEELRPLTGLNKPVYDYVFGNAQAVELRAKLFDMLDFLIPLYIAEGKVQLTIAIGCTGGHHRSVAFAADVSAHLSAQGYSNTVLHRDKDK